MQPILSSGILQADIGLCPAQPSTDGLSAYRCETALSGVLGQYNMDFTRFVTMAAPVASFSHCRIHKGGMSIKRIDTGATTGISSVRSVTAGVYGAFGGATMNQFGVAPSLLRIHYIRLPTTQSLTSNFDIPTFMNDPRRKCRSLRVGRKISFTFNPVAHTRRHMTIMSRNANVVPGNPPTETDNFQDLVIPGRDRKLGWVPTGLFTTTTSMNTYEPLAEPEVAGLPTNAFRIISTTVLFLFDWNGAGAFSSNIYNLADPPVIDGNIAYTPVSPPTVTRSEWCKFSVRGLRMSQIQYPGQCTSVVAYGTNTVAGNVTKELFTTPELYTLPQIYNQVPAYPGMSGPFVVTPGVLQATATGPIPST